MPKKDDEALISVTVLLEFCYNLLKSIFFYYEDQHDFLNETKLNQIELN